MGRWGERSARPRSAVYTPSQVKSAEDERRWSGINRLRTLTTITPQQDLRVIDTVATYKEHPRRARGDSRARGVHWLEVGGEIGASFRDTYNSTVPLPQTDTYDSTRPETSHRLDYLPPAVCVHITHIASTNAQLRPKPTRTDSRPTENVYVQSNQGRSISCLCVLCSRRSFDRRISIHRHPN